MGLIIVSSHYLPIVEYFMMEGLRVELKEGDRVILIKPDGSFLIHTNTKREPVNWQPPGSIISWELKGGEIVLKSVRKKPREILEVELLKVYPACSFKCGDYEELNLTGSEAEMAELIFKNPSLIEKGSKQFLNFHSK